MELNATYSSNGLFTMGELRALVDQQKALPDEATVYLKGDADIPGKTDGEDAIMIEWLDA